MAEGDDDDQKRGLYRKYLVRKRVCIPRWEVTGESAEGQNGHWVEHVLTYKDPGECFVLAHTDPFAPVALRAYAEACESEYGPLAKDLREMADRWEAAQA